MLVGLILCRSYTGNQDVYDQETLFLKKIYFIYRYENVCVSLCVYGHMNIGSPETGVIGCFELCDVDTRNETQVLCKSKQVLLTSELHLQPKGKLF